MKDKAFRKQDTEIKRAYSSFFIFHSSFIIVLYLLAVAWFFFPFGAPEEKSLLFSLRLALPAALLALGGIGLLPWLMTAAFFFCAIGDALGVLGSFEGQIGGFAVAHICFIIWLTKQIKTDRLQTNRQKGFFSSYIYITPLCLVPLFIAAVRIIPEIHNTPIRVGCIIYSLLLTGTLWTAWLRMTTSPRPRKWQLLTALGATLFLVSDFVLSWNRFVESVPNSRNLIMTTYYAALLLLFMGEAYKNKKKSHF